MKADESLRGIPTLVITGGTLERQNREVLDGFGITPLSKPWPEEELLSRIEASLLGISLSSTIHPVQPGGGYER
jgi:hypothetical protein